MRNIVEQTELIKSLPDTALIREMKQPTGNLGPPVFITAELKSRKRFRDEHKRIEAQDMPTVAEEVVMAAGVPQQGIMQMARNMAPKTNMGQNTGMADMMPRQPTMGMSSGGVVKMEPGGIMGGAPTREVVFEGRRYVTDGSGRVFEAARSGSMRRGREVTDPDIISAIIGTGPGVASGVGGLASLPENLDLTNMNIPNVVPSFDRDQIVSQAGQFMGGQALSEGDPTLGLIDPSIRSATDQIAGIGSTGFKTTAARNAELEESARNREASLATPQKEFTPFDDLLGAPTSRELQLQDLLRARQELVPGTNIPAMAAANNQTVIPEEVDPSAAQVVEGLSPPAFDPNAFTGRQSLDGRMVSTVGPTAAEIERAQKVLEMNPSATAPKEDVDVLASAFTAKPPIQYTEAGDLTDELVDQPQALTYDQLVKKQLSGAKITEDDLVRSVEAGILNDQQAADVSSMIDSDYTPTAQSQDIANLEGVGKFTKADNTANPDMLVPKVYGAATDFLAGVLPEKALGIVPINPGGPRTVKEQMDIDAERKKKSDAYKAYAESKGIDLSNVGAGPSIGGFSNAITDLFDKKPDTSDPKEKEKEKDKVAELTGEQDNQPQTTEEFIGDLDGQDKTTTVNKAAEVVLAEVGKETLAAASGAQGPQVAAQAQQGFSDKQWLDIAALGAMISSGNPADLREASKLFIKLQEASRGRKSKEKMATADRASRERVATARVNATVAATEQRRASAKARNSLDALETIAESVQNEMNTLTSLDGKTVPPGNKDAYDKLKSSLDRIMKDIAGMGGTSLAAYGADDIYQDNIDVG